MALSWILSKVENLESSSLQDEATDWLIFSELQGPSLIINLAKLVSPSVALPAELVSMFSFTFLINTILYFLITFSLVEHHFLQLNTESRIACKEDY